MAILLIQLISCFVLFIEQTHCLHRYSCDQNVSTTNELYICVLLPKNNTYLHSYQRVFPAIQLGISRVRDQKILPDLDIVLIYHDTDCDPATGDWKAIETYIKKPVNLFLGPSCDYVAAPLARWLKFMKVPMITAGAIAYDFNAHNRTDENSEYYMLVRTGWTLVGMANTMHQVLQRFGWRNVLLLYEADGRYEIMKEHFCFFAIQSIYELIFNKKNYTVRKNKLMPGMSKEETRDLVRSSIGNKHGD